MIRVEGFKAFRGVMRITPKPKEFEPFELAGDWLFKPDTRCWYGNGRSFHDDICSETSQDKDKTKDKDKDNTRTPS